MLRNHQFNDNNQTQNEKTDKKPREEYSRARFINKYRHMYEYFIANSYVKSFQ